VRVSFWGLNLGLVSMIVFSLFPGGVMQLYEAEPTQGAISLNVLEHPLNPGLLGSLRR
jgi:nitric oxide reductase large subunit